MDEILIDFIVFKEWIGDKKIFIINVCCVIVFKKLIFLEVNCFKWDVSLLDVKVIILIIFYVVICGGILF